MPARVDREMGAWSEQWARQALTEADRIEEQIRIAQVGDRPDEQWLAITAAIKRHLAATRAACQRPSRWLHGLLDRWQGISVGRAYVNLHAAQVLLVDLLPDEDVEVLLPDASARVAAILDAADPRRVGTAWLLRSPDADVRRSALRAAYKTIHDSTDMKYVRLRSFRNVTILAIGLLTVLVTVLVLFARSMPEAIPLCFDAVDSQSGELKEITVCPSGVRPGPSSNDVLIVVLLGAVGGGLTGVSSLRYIRGTSFAYGLPLALAILKVVTGALTAVTGLLLIRGDFIPGLFGLETQYQILAYAFLFGASQQVITRFQDEQAQALLPELSFGETLLPDRELAPPKPVTDDLRRAVNESVQASLTTVLRRPVVSNVEGNVDVSARAESADRLELTITITTGPDAWRNAAEQPNARAFRLTGGEDQPIAPFEMVIDAPGLQVIPTRTSIELGTDGASYEWTVPVLGDRTEEVPIWVTLYSSGRYVQAIKLATETQAQGDGHR
jgi:hypothetical protein